MIKGIIFDVDGTLLNSMPVWENLGELYLRAQGKSAEKGLRDILYTMGVRQGAAYLKTQYGLDQTIEEVIEGLNREVRGFYEKKVPLKEGVREYLERFRELSLPMMLATSGDKTNVRAALSRLGILSWFEGILTCLEMGTDKNHPDVFLAAALQMDLDPSEILVFEDALYAIQTAKRAGFRTVAVYDKANDRDLAKIWKLAEIYLPEYTEFDIFWRRISKTIMKKKQKYIGIIYIILSAFCFALMSMFVRLSEDLPAIQKSFFRNLVALVFAGIILAKEKGMVFRKERECQYSSGTSDSRNTWCAVQFLRGRSYDPVGCVDAQQNVSVFSRSSSVI